MGLGVTLRCSVLMSIHIVPVELAEGKVHLASLVKIVENSRHTRELCHFIPLAFELSCNTFSAANEEAPVEDVMTL